MMQNWLNPGEGYSQSCPDPDWDFLNITYRVKETSGHAISGTRLVEVTLDTDGPDEEIVI